MWQSLTHVKSSWLESRTSPSDWLVFSRINKTFRSKISQRNVVLKLISLGAHIHSGWNVQCFVAFGFSFLQMSETSQKMKGPAV